MAGRTHGQHALPITFGFKVALWADELQRHRTRLDELKPRLLVGKMSGAVGSYAGLGDDRVERLVMARLGLAAPCITSQVVPRDGLAEFMAALGLIAATLDKVGREIRNLARTEIHEVEEPFKTEQVGSSTMPQKRNPHRSERLCGLARIVKANVIPALENISLEHERDISHSSVERAILPESCILADYLLREATDILAGLRVDPARMQHNLALSGAFMGAEAVMLRLVDAGLGRQEAHELVRRAAWQALDQGRDFAEVLKESGVGRYLDEATLMACLAPENYLGQCVTVTEHVINELSDQR
jgi:adenylosuccinate lyase